MFDFAPCAKYNTFISVRAFEWSRFFSESEIITYRWSREKIFGLEVKGVAYDSRIS